MNRPVPQLEGRHFITQGEEAKQCVTLYPRYRQEQDRETE